MPNVHAIPQRPAFADIVKFPPVSRQRASGQVNSLIGQSRRFKLPRQVYDQSLRADPLSCREDIS